MRRAPPPAQIGPYPIERKLDEGGFGEVFIARQPNLGNRHVCIKRIHARHVGSDDAHFIAMFTREVDLVSKLSHANIVSVIDAGQDEHDDDLPYVVMEYVKGTNARQLLRTHRPLAPEHVAYIIVRVAQALAYAHQQAVIHRDIKPANILIGLSGEVKLTDFGISRIQQHGKYALTSTQSIAGTSGYMAPELLSFLDADEPEVSSRFDHRVDLWALGVSAFELLCGFRPFEDETLSKPGNRSRESWVRGNILRQDRRPVHELRPDVPPALREVIEDLLLPLDERITTAEEVERRLINASLGLPTHRRAFVKLFVKDTLPERAAYRPDDVETQSAPPSTANAASTAPAMPGVGVPRAQQAPLSATAPMVLNKTIVTPPPYPASEALPSSPQHPHRRSRSPLLIAVIGLAVFGGVAAGVLLVIANLFGVGAESTVIEPAAATDPQAPETRNEAVDPPSPAAPSISQGPENETTAADEESIRTATTSAVEVPIHEDATPRTTPREEPLDEENSAAGASPRRPRPSPRPRPEVRSLESPQPVAPRPRSRRTPSTSDLGF